MARLLARRDSRIVADCSYRLHAHWHGVVRLTPPVIKGAALIACIGAVLVGMLVVSLLPEAPASLGNPDMLKSPTICEDVRRDNPNHPLRRHFCHPEESTEPKFTRPKTVEL